MSKSVLIAQISDLHISAPDAPNARVDTSATLRRAVEVLNTMQPRPDCVIATGDLVEHGTDVEYKILFGILGELDVPLYVLPGNHDNGPLLRVHLHFHGYLRADQPGHLGTVIDAYDVRIVLVDTTEPTRRDGVFSAARAEWLDGVLGGAPDRPTLVAMHHPPFATGIRWMDATGIEALDRARFERVVRAHRQVRHVISGHVHRSISSSWGSTSLTVCPSTAYQVALSLGRDAPALLSLEAPSLQLHQWTGDGFVTNTRPLDFPGLCDLSGRFPN